MLGPNDLVMLVKYVFLGITMPYNNLLFSGVPASASKLYSPYLAHDDVFNDVVMRVMTSSRHKSHCEPLCQTMQMTSYDNTDVWRLPNNTIEGAYDCKAVHTCL